MIRVYLALKCLKCQDDCQYMTDTNWCPVNGKVPYFKMNKYNSKTNLPQIRILLFQSLLGYFDGDL